MLLIFASYVIKLKQNDCFADWIQFRSTFPLSSFLLVTACVLTFFEAINCSTWSYVELSSLPLDKTKKTVIIVFIIHYRKFVWHMDDCSVICMSWVNLRDRVGKERRRQTLCDNRDNIKKSFVEEQKKIKCQVKIPKKHPSNTPVSALSHTSVLPSASFCHPVA